MVGRDAINGKHARVGGKVFDLDAGRVLVGGLDHFGVFYPGEFDGRVALGGGAHDLGPHPFRQALLKVKGRDPGRDCPGQVHRQQAISTGQEEVIYTAGPGRAGQLGGSAGLKATKIE